MIETTAITAITPITIPSRVSSDRRRLARRDESAIKTASAKFTTLYYDRLAGFVSPSSAELFLKQPNLLFHGLLWRRWSRFDRRSVRPGRLLPLLLRLERLGRPSSTLRSGLSRLGGPFLPPLLPRFLP